LKIVKEMVMTTEGTRAPEADYLAVILIGCGSSWGRARDKNEAIANAIHSFRDWQSLYKVSNIEVTVNVADVRGYSDVSWGHFGFHGTNELTGKDEKFEPKVEQVKAFTPKWRKR
jgi:hypothetical protein